MRYPASFLTVPSVPQGQFHSGFKWLSWQSFLAPAPSPFRRVHNLVTITSKNAFLTFSTDITLEGTHGSGNANSGLQYFFVFMSPHTSGYVLDNYVKYLGWIPDWKSSKDKQINHTLKEGTGPTCTLTRYTRHPWVIAYSERPRVIAYSERNAWAREKLVKKMAGQSNSFCFLQILDGLPFPSPIFLPPSQLATDILVMNVDLHANKPEAHVYSCTL